MKKLILIASIATLALSATACTTAGKTDLAKTDLDEVEPLSDRTFSLDDQSSKCYVRTKASVVKRKGVSNDFTFPDGEVEFSEIKTKEECMAKAMELAQEYPSSQVGELDRRMLMPEPTVYHFYIAWGFGQKKRGFMGTQFVGEYGEVSKATQLHVSGYPSGDQRFHEDGSKWSTN